MNDDIGLWARQFSTIVLEGTDGTGKTLRAKALAAQHGFTYIHSGRTPDDINLVNRYHKILHSTGNLVLDRSFISEAVYGPVFRDRSRLEITELIGLTELVADRKGVIVYLY